MGTRTSRDHRRASYSNSFPTAASGLDAAHTECFRTTTNVYPAYESASSQDRASVTSLLSNPIHGHESSGPPSTASNVANRCGIHHHYRTYPQVLDSKAFEYSLMTLLALLIFILSSRAVAIVALVARQVWNRRLHPFASPPTARRLEAVDVNLHDEQDVLSTKRDHYEDERIDEQNERVEGQHKRVDDHFEIAEQPVQPVEVQTATTQDTHADLLVALLDIEFQNRGRAVQPALDIAQPLEDNPAHDREPGPAEASRDCTETVPSAGAPPAADTQAVDDASEHISREPELPEREQTDAVEERVMNTDGKAREFLDLDLQERPEPNVPEDRQAVTRSSLSPVARGDAGVAAEDVDPLVLSPAQGVVERIESHAELVTQDTVVANLAVDNSNIVPGAIADHVEHGPKAAHRQPPDVQQYHTQLYNDAQGGQARLPQTDGGDVAGNEEAVKATVEVEHALGTPLLDSQHLEAVDATLEAAENAPEAGQALSLRTPDDQHAMEDAVAVLEEETAIGDSATVKDLRSLLHGHEEEALLVPLVREESDIEQVKADVQLVEAAIESVKPQEVLVVDQHDFEYKHAASCPKNISASLRSASQGQGCNCAIQPMIQRLRAAAAKPDPFSATPALATGKENTPPVKQTTIGRMKNTATGQSGPSVPAPTPGPYTPFAQGHDHPEAESSNSGENGFSPIKNMIRNKNKHDWYNAQPASPDVRTWYPRWPATAPSSPAEPEILRRRSYHF